MAKQKGIINLKGTLGYITFYKSQDGFLARERGGVDASGIATDDVKRRKIVRWLAFTGQHTFT